MSVPGAGLTSINHRRGLDRHQTLLPERLEDYIAADNPVRFLDAFVGSLDLRALGFAHAGGSNTRQAVGCVSGSGGTEFCPVAILACHFQGLKTTHGLRFPELAGAFEAILDDVPNPQGPITDDKNISGLGHAGRLR